MSSYGDVTFVVHVLLCDSLTHFIACFTAVVFSTKWVYLAMSGYVLGIYSIYNLLVVVSLHASN